MTFYTTLRAKENLHRFFGKFHTFECVKFTQHIRESVRESVRESRSPGSMGPSLFAHCFIHATMVTRGRGGGDGRGRGCIGGGNEKTTTRWNKAGGRFLLPMGKPQHVVVRPPANIEATSSPRLLPDIGVDPSSPFRSDGIGRALDCRLSLSS